MSYFSWEAIVDPRKLISKIAVVPLCLSGISQPALSHGGLAQNRWNPAHLRNLLPEFRAIVQKWDAACGRSIAAAQQSALYGFQS